MTTTQLGPRPEDPSKISLSPECFEVIGTETYYSVKARFGFHNVEFSSIEDAQKYARGRMVCGPCVREVTRRVKWC